MPGGQIKAERSLSGTRRIGILTGGGDVPGLNSVIKSVVYRATEVGDEVFGIRRGWEGLTHLRFDPLPDPNYIVRLDRTNTRTIDRTGGTWLHTSRTNPKKMKGSIADALRGSMNADDFRDYMVSFLFLRYLSDIALMP